MRLKYTALWRAVCLVGGVTLGMLAGCSASTLPTATPPPTRTPEVTGSSSPTPEPTTRPTDRPTAEPSSTRPPAASATPRPTSPPPTLTPTPPLAAEYAVLTNITPRARAIFEDGQQQGNRPHVFSKVGDSLTHSWYFLFQIGDGNYELGDYTYLEDVVALYREEIARTGNSFNNISYAAFGGWASADVLDPDHVAAACPGLTPLACEYHTVRPAIALIMIGTNDAGLGVPPDRYEQNLRQIVDISIDYGVLSVLYLLPEFGMGEVAPYNAIIEDVALDYQIPLVDYHTPMQALPNKGISDDGVHPSAPEDERTAVFTEDYADYGFTLRNLLTLHVLDRLHREVIIHDDPIPTPTRSATPAPG